MPEITYRVDRPVAVISFANPPVNGLSHAVRVGISAALERAQTDPSVRAIVLTGAGSLFSGGADIREFGTLKAMGARNGAVVRVILSQAMISAALGFAVGAPLAYMQEVNESLSALKLDLFGP